MKKCFRDGDPLFTIRRLISHASCLFEKNGVDSPQITAEILLSHVMNLTKSRLYLSFDQEVSPEKKAAFDRLVSRRLKREPVAYIIGEKGFWTFSLEVTSDVLIPRPDTECLVETALISIPEKKSDVDPFRVLDLGTGSGAIIVALAKERPGHQYFATDISMKALRVAKRNGDRNQLNCKVHYICGNWFDAIMPGQNFDVIVSNPPYINTAVIATLEPEIRRYEPVLALDGNSDGLSAFRVIITAAATNLKPGGLLVMEMGDGQENDLLAMIEKNGGYAPPTFHRDLTGKIRVVLTKKI